MMNLGVVLPEPGYLEAVREITRKHGIVLIFDEVKTGLCIAAGGAIERFGVVPDLVTLAKALGGGLPVRRDRRHRGGHVELVEDGKVYQVGTYNGNPLSMAAARANLLEVMTPEAYAHLDALNDRIARRLPGGDREVQASRATPSASARRAASRSRPRRSSTTRRSRRTRTPSSAELAWLYNMNRGIFMTPGPRGGVDAVDHAHRRGRRPLRRRRSTRWRAS